MKLLITGGTGFVGTRACELLSQNDHRCVAFDRLPFTSKVKAEFVEGDIRDRERLSNAAKGCDAILHLAAAHHDFGITTETFHAVNVEGTENVCAAATSNAIHQLCFYSSVAVYGSQQPPIDETTQPLPESDYGRTKLAAEAVCRQWSETDDRNRCLVIRPTVIFGPDNFANMFTLIRQIDSGRFLRVGSMNNVKSLAYIDNILQATFQLWLDDGHTGPNYEVYNFVDKPDLKSHEIVDAIYRSLGRKPPAFAVPYTIARLLAIPFDVVIGLTGKNLPVSSARIKKLAKANTRFEASKIHTAVSMNPVPLEEGIGRMVRWYLDSGKTETVINRRPPQNPS